MDEELWSSDQHDGKVRRILFSENGEHIVIAGKLTCRTVTLRLNVEPSPGQSLGQLDKVLVWSIAENKEVWNISQDTFVLDIAWLTDTFRPQLATLCDNGTLLVFPYLNLPQAIFGPTRCFSEAHPEISKPAHAGRLSGHSTTIVSTIGDDVFMRDIVKEAGPYASYSGLLPT
jgi:hypothetical protein